MSLAYRFFVIGILFALIGMGLGTYMGITQDFLLAPVHAHINLVGWTTHFLFGLYYRGEPANSKACCRRCISCARWPAASCCRSGSWERSPTTRRVDLAVIPGQSSRCCRWCSSWRWCCAAGGARRRLRRCWSGDSRFGPAPRRCPRFRIGHQFVGPPRRSPTRREWTVL